VIPLVAHNLRRGGESWLEGDFTVKDYSRAAERRGTRRLEALIRKGRAGPAAAEGADMLKADVSEAVRGWRDSRIIKALETSASDGYRVRKQLVEEGFERVLSPPSTGDMPGGGADWLTAQKEAKLIALACSKAPKAPRALDLGLLENKVVELRHVRSRQRQHDRGGRSKKTLSSPIAGSVGFSRPRAKARS